MFHKIVWLRFLFGALFCSTSILLLVSCGRSNKQVVNPILVDTLSEEKSLNETNNNLQSKSRTNLPYVLPIDSLWEYYDAAWTTSGRCNRPEIFDDDSSKNLMYGFYTVLDSRSSSSPPIVASIIVSYRKNKSWKSSDTTQKIRMIHVKDRLFTLPIAPFHVGEPIRCIKDKAVFKKDCYLCYSGEKYCYVVQSSKDTIQQFYVLPHDLTSDWPRILKYVETY
jgi:hypothetical protein